MSIEHPHWHSININSNSEIFFEKFNELSGEERRKNQKTLQSFVNIPEYFVFTPLSSYIMM